MIFDQVQQLLNSYKVDSKFIQLDNIEEGDDIQDALLDMTGSRTVPQVFIGGTFIGGCEGARMRFVELQN